jgi:hypothetical protein
MEYWNANFFIVHSYLDDEDDDADDISHSL